MGPFLLHHFCENGHCPRENFHHYWDSTSPLEEQFVHFQKPPIWIKKKYLNLFRHKVYFIFEGHNLGKVFAQRSLIFRALNVAK